MNAKDVILARRMGGGSVPKPLTYDYMPEGYPTKVVQTTVLMEEQEVAFSYMDGAYGAVLTDALSIVAGRTYTVKWDGTEYNCVASSVDGILVIGNLSFAGVGEDSGEPFVYNGSNKVFGTPDISPSHTIGVKTTGEVVTQMAEEFLPAGTTVFYAEMATPKKLKHADGTLVTAQEAYDAFMNTRVLIHIGIGVATATGIEWYDNNSAQSDPTNVGYVIMYYYTPNASSATSVSIGDASLKPA